MELTRMWKNGILLCLVATTIVSGVDKSLQEFSDGNQKFTADVIRAVFSDEHNMGIISPLSAQLVLSLTAEGAEGDTYNELKRALYIPDKKKTAAAVKSLLPILNKSSQDFNLSLVDKIFIDYRFKLKQSFQNVAVNDYQSKVESVNFKENNKAAEIINKFVESQTGNKIKDMVNPSQLNANTALVLVNTMYLNAKWATPFPLEKTRKEEFQFLRTSAGQVDMMHSADDARYLYFHCGYLKAKFLEIPYKDSSVSATFVLPDRKDGIVDAEKNLELYLAPRNLTLQRVRVSMPRFSASTYHDFKEILMDSGVKRLFSSTEADLSDLSDEKGLFVNFVQQKAFINVTEVGTEAATATAVGVGTTAVMDPPKLTFNADHPFLFFIREKKSNIILFVSRFQ